MNIYAKCFFLLMLAASTVARGEGSASIRAKWEMPPKCDPFAPVKIKDLRDELRATGYRLVIALHPERPASEKGEYPPRDLYLINADGSGLKQLTDTPDQEEHIPRTSPDGKRFTYNYGDYLVDAKTLKSRPIWGGYAWTPDSRQTVYCKKERIVYTDIQTGETTRGARTGRNVSLADMSFDGGWLIFEIRDFMGSKYSVDFLSVDGGEIRKMPNHPAGGGECHPGFSPDGKWMCWNGGGSLSVRKFDPTLPEGTDGKIVTLPKEKLGQDPCGRWSHCGRYIAYVKIPHAGSWRAHSPICIVRLADSETITISPDGWQGHHWDYDWLPPEDE